MNIFSNSYVKIVCLVLSFGFWIFASLQMGRIGTFPSEIEIKTLNTPQNLLAILSEENVKVKISAQTQDWQKLTASGFSASVDLAGLAKGIFEVPVQVSSNWPGVQIIKVMPDKIQVALEEVESQTFNIESKFEGDAKEGFAVSSVVFSPAEVTVESSATQLKKIAKVAAKIILDGEEETFSRVYPIAALDSQGNFLSQIKFSSQESTARVVIGKAGNIKIVGVKAKITDAPINNLYVSAVSANPATVAIRGAASRLTSLEYIETSPISVADKNQSFEAEVSLNLPSGITLVDNLSKVRISIQIAENQMETTLENKNFQYAGLPAGLSVSSINPNSIKLTLKGPAELIAGVKESDITIQLDLTGLKAAGSHSITLFKNQIILPAKIELKNFSPQALEITLKSS